MCGNFFFQKIQLSHPKHNMPESKLMIQFKENVHADNKRTSRTYFIRLFWLLLTRIKKKTKLLCLLFEMNQSYFITHPANFEKFRHAPCPSSTKIEGFKIHHFERSTLALQEDCCLQKQEEDQKSGDSYAFLFDRR